MSNKYKTPDQVPTPVICDRLKELSNAVTQGQASTIREFDMRIPCENDRDADCILAEAAKRLTEKSKAVEYRFGTGNICMTQVSRKDDGEYGIRLKREVKARKIGSVETGGSTEPTYGKEGETFLMCSNKESAVALLKAVEELVARFDG